MTEKCEHKTTSILGYHGNVSLEACDWGCGAILVSITDGNGISHEFTADELLALREREAALLSIRQHERELYADGGRVAYTNPDLKWQEMYLGLFDMLVTEATE